ncbi:MAG: lysophospholipase [Betaproteobacteria bacterium]|jgi:alpha-beta hydrolase superfamily lysophospholipase|nr:lysophospholipase [Betaproteobacteria bacterium]
MTALLRQLAYVAGYGTLGIALTLATALGVHLTRLPPLKPWHLAPLAAEFRAADSPNFSSLDDYRALEARLMADLDAEVYAEIPADERFAVNRYSAGSLADARRRAPNWNLTFEFPVPAPKGAALLLHGLTDSPYSMRAMAEIFAARGWYVVGLRLPGHGTAPSALTGVTWDDWAAAVRLAARHLRARAGPDVPLVLAGYSTGAALSVEYALATLQGEPLPRAAGLVLLSPAIGVSPVAALAVWPGRLARWTGWQKLAWTEFPLEYDPYKYNGFTANAGDQMYQLTRRIREQVDALDKGSGVVGMPPVLAFQSVADATVSAPAVVRTLFGRLAPEGHALVGFDVNREAEVEPLLSPAARTASVGLLEGPPLPFDLTVLGNATLQGGIQGAAVIARHRAAGATTIDVQPTGLRWPHDTYSLSHVSLPFRPDDPVYGATPPVRWDFIFLGKMGVFGERGVLSVSPGEFARLRHNPFFPYVEARVNAFLAARER